jgi:acetylglutamate kinase
MPLAEAESLVKSQGVGEGMIPKLASVISLLHGGGKPAHIIDGFKANRFLREVFTDQGGGTMIEV